VFHAFKKSAKKFKNRPFLGKRDDSQEGRPYIWMTYGEAEIYINNLAKGLKALNMMEDVTSDSSV
jgi:hypothetical protein